MLLSSLFRERLCKSEQKLKQLCELNIVAVYF